MSETGQDPAVSIVRRLGTTPAQRGSTNDMNCPDVFLLSDGSIALVGKALVPTGDVPQGNHLDGSGVMVAVPRGLILDAVADIEAAARAVSDG